MMQIHGVEDPYLVESIKKFLFCHRPDISMLFNPSFATLPSGDVVFTLRGAIPRRVGRAAERKQAVFIKSGGNFHSLQLVDEQAGEKVRDLRFTQLNNDSPFGQTMFSFNTGHEIDRKNSIYIGNDISNFASASEVIYPERRSIEKNWGFFEHGGELLAIYSLRPLVLLRKTKAGAHEINFEKIFEDSSSLDSNWTLASQPLKRDGHLLFMVHHKYEVLGKRTYLPHLASLRLETWEVELAKLKVSLSDPPLGFSRLNKNAFNVKYASGLGEIDGNLFVGIGLNDERFSMVNLPNNLTG